MGIDQPITAAEMKAYDGLFAAPIPYTVLTAIAALVDRSIPESVAPSPFLSASVDVACES